MKCAICGIGIDSVHEATEGGWITYFYEGDKEHEFACAGCSEVFLQVGEDKEMEVGEEYRRKIIYQDEATKEHLAMWFMFKSSNLG